MGWCAEGSGTLNLPSDIDSNKFEVLAEASAEHLIFEWSVPGDVTSEPGDITYFGKHYNDAAIEWWDWLASIGTTGFLDYRGEDGSLWRIRFRDGQWSDHTGEVVYATDTEETP